MNLSKTIFWLFLFFLRAVNCHNSEVNELLGAIKLALNSGGVLDENYRQHQYGYRPTISNGITLGLYEALRSITKNDDLECIPRLLCEAAAGGQPGFSGKQIKFDKLSLSNLMSYLNINVGTSSPLLVFAKAALRGASNRGDPYSCIINYPKCPKDQSRLLHYLNNHRGGLFQYFDKKQFKPINSFAQNHYRPGYPQQYYHNKKKISFESLGELYKGTNAEANDVYAKKFKDFIIKFPTNENRSNRPMVFPNDGQSRILVKPPRETTNNQFNFSGLTRFPKKVETFNFFPKKEKRQKQVIGLVTDRLPSKFHFPVADEKPQTSSDISEGLSPHVIFPEN